MSIQIYISTQEYKIDFCLRMVLLALYFNRNMEIQTDKNGYILSFACFLLFKLILLYSLW